MEMPLYQNPLPQDNLEIQEETNVNDNQLDNTIQVPIALSQSSLPFGDILNKKTPHYIRIFFRKINGFHRADSWTELPKFVMQLHKAEINIVGLAETKVRWDVRTQLKATQVFEKTYKECIISTASNSEKCKTLHQPGGTLTAVTGKFYGRVIRHIKDIIPMRRWSGIRIATNYSHSINIVTTYQSIKAEGIHTLYRQQLHYLQNKGIHALNPRKILLQDLSNEISKRNEAGDLIIVLTDANDNLFSSDSLLPSFLSKTELVSLVPNPQYHPATHVRGSKCIDFMFGSLQLVEHIKNSGITSFFEEPCGVSDH
jgi:hypothetical protein